MSPEDSDAFQPLIDRLRQGDEEARHGLIVRAYERLRRLAEHIFLHSFPRLQGRHELDSVLNETYLRLWQALDSMRPPTVKDFLRLAAHKIRQVLLDLAERQDRQPPTYQPPDADTSNSGQPHDPGTDTFDPAKLALWTEFHNNLHKLTDEERQVFELQFYLEMTQAEIGALMELHPKKVSRLWIAATEKLADHLPS